jgi:hypothetical protein
MEGERTEEKRRFPRFDFSVDVYFKKKASAEKEKLSLTKNISGVGVCLISYDDLLEADILELQICFSDTKDPLQVLGKVVWTKEFVIGEPQKGKRYDVGVEFIGLDEEAKKKINQHLFILSK